MRLAGTLVAVVLGSACGGPARPAPLVVGDGDGAGMTVGGGGTTGDGAGAGDGTTAPPAGTALPAPPADLARADLVTLDGGVITAYAVADGKLAELGRRELAPLDPEDFASLDGDWADRDHLVLWLPERDVVLVTPDAITRLTVPPPAAFKTPRPKVDNDADLDEGGVLEMANTGLVVAGGAAWWVECPWGYAYDGWQCEQWRRAQLWPKPAAAAEDGQVDDDTWPWPTATPSGYRTKALDDGRRLGCTPPPGTRQKQHIFVGGGDGEEVHSFHWVATTPPRLLVVYGSPGLADLVPSRWTLHDGCLERALAQGTDVTPGPAGLWFGDESPDLTADEVITHRILHRGADVIGELPDGAVRFRPPAK